MMMEEQPVSVLEPAQLPARVEALRQSGHRLVQVCATALADAFEVTYTFEGESRLQSLRVMVPRANPVVPSITGAYFAAFTYENELQDLFGLKVEGLKLDFKGTFYHLAKTTPFAEPKQK